MKIDVNHTMDSIKEGTKEVAETAHVKTSEFHENYVSKVIPDLGKYGDEAKFVAEMLPGVSEYNAIKEGDWQAFAIAAGLDVAALAAGAITAGTGYAAVKGGTTLAKTGVKTAAKEVAEAGTKKLVKEAAEAGAEKLAKEATEAGAEKVAKELVETGAEKAAKEIAEAGAEKAAQEVTEASTKKGINEVTETLTEKGIKEVDESIRVIKNKEDGLAREAKALKTLVSKYGDEFVLREQYLRDNLGRIIKDPITNEARRIDMLVVDKWGKVIRSIEVTSQTADKVNQTQKELRILNHAWDNGGAFIKNANTGKLIEFTRDTVWSYVKI